MSAEENNFIYRLSFCLFFHRGVSIEDGCYLLKKIESNIYVIIYFPSDIFLKYIFDVAKLLGTFFE